MVCHETYKDQKGNWISPEEIITIDGKKFLKKDKSQSIIVGPSESMSKSKKNTIDPEEIIKSYGADSVRLFILSDSPPEKDVQWSEDGINSAFKFLQKLWILNQKIIKEINSNHPSTDDIELEKVTNRFTENVEKNIENFSYNKIIANLYETYSALNKLVEKKYDKNNWIKNYKNILITLNPVLPHFANECLQNLEVEVDKLVWPKINKKILIEDKVNFVIQINGKKRGIVITKKGINQEELLKEISMDEKLTTYTVDKSIKKVIFIPDKLMNIII